MDNECNRLEILLNSLSSNTATSSIPSTVPSTKQSTPISPCNILQTIRRLTTDLKSNNYNCWDPTSWSNDFHRVLATISTTLNILQKGGQNPPVTVFQPLDRPMFWPAQWLWPLGDLSNVVTGTNNGKIIGYLQETEAMNSLQSLQDILHSTSELLSSKQYNDLLTIVTSSLEKERWDHHQSHPYKAKRCSSGLHFWCSEMRSLQRKATDMTTSILSRTIHEQWMSDWIRWSGRDLVEWYVEIISNVSRARTEQFDVDVTMLVVELCSLMGHAIEIENDTTIGTNTKAETKVIETTDVPPKTMDLKAIHLFDLHSSFIEFVVSKLLVMLAIVRAPLPLVLAFIHKISIEDDVVLQTQPLKKEDVPIFSTEPLSVFLSSLSNIKTIQTTNSNTKTLTTPNFSPMNDVITIGNVGTLKEVNVEELKNVIHPWEKMLVPGILQRHVILECAYKRHELSDAWIYPPLKKEEEIGKDMLTKKLNEMLNGDDTLKPLVMIDPMMDPMMDPMVITKETKV